MRSSTSFPIVISGPSGAGKTTLVEKLLSRLEGVAKSVSVTTRPPRRGEVNGRDYFFVSEEQFEKMKKNELVEWAEVHGHYYGTPKRFLEEELRREKDVLLNIDVQGGINAKKVFPEAVMIFILPPSFEVLKKRILRRGGDDSSSVELRFENAKREIASLGMYDYLVINDKLEQATDDVVSIIKAERAKRFRYPDNFLHRFFD